MTGEQWTLCDLSLCNVFAVIFDFFLDVCVFIYLKYSTFYQSIIFWLYFCTLFQLAAVFYACCPFILQIWSVNCNFCLGCVLQGLVLLFQGRLCSLLFCTCIICSSLMQHFILKA